MSRGFQQWQVRRTDLGSADAGVYGKPALVIVYADGLEDALAQGAALMGVDESICTAIQVYYGFGVGETG